MHVVCGFPVKSTWLKAVKAGNYIGWSMLTTKNVTKYYPDTIKAPKGNLNQTQKKCPQHQAGVATTRDF
jgi:hypothetical protein